MISLFSRRIYLQSFQNEINIEVKCRIKFVYDPTMYTTYTVDYKLKLRFACGIWIFLFSVQIIKKLADYNSGETLIGYQSKLVGLVNG